MLRALALVAPIALTACVSQTSIEDLQRVFGPKNLSFEQREVGVDLNGDGQPERLVLLADRRRGLNLRASESALSDGVLVDAFALFDGRLPNVPVFYQYSDNNGYALRLDEVDGQILLVSDGGRDHAQHVWGWWDYPDHWPIDGWEARWRPWEEKQSAWGAWRSAPLISVIVGK